MQSEKHTEGQPCLKTLLAAELFSDLTEEDQEMSYLDAQILRLLHQLTRHSRTCSRILLNRCF